MKLQNTMENDNENDKRSKSPEQLNLSDSLSKHNLSPVSHITQKLQELSPGDSAAAADERRKVVVEDHTSTGRTVAPTTTTTTTKSAGPVVPDGGDSSEISALVEGNKKEKSDEEDGDEGGDDGIGERKFLRPFIDRIQNALGNKVEEIVPLRGGAYNGIIKVKLKCHNDENAKFVIYRIPKDWEVEMAPDSFLPIKDTAAVHSLLCADEGLNFRIPKILEYDITPNNYLKHPYTIMEYINGISLVKVYGYLPHYARVQIAEQVAAVIWKMEQVTFEKAGRLVAVDKDSGPPAGGGKTAAAVKLTGFGVRDREGYPIMNEPADDIKGLFFNQIEGWMEAERTFLAETKQSDDTETFDRLEQMEQVAQNIARLGYFDDDGGKNVLHHWDLHARNILVQLDPSVILSTATPESVLKQCVFFDPRTETPGTRIKIVAVLDWDDMYAVPRVLSRSPPFWLWDDNAPREITSPHQINNKRLCKSDADLYPVTRWEAEGGVLSPYALDVKRRFDLKMEELLPGYCNDAYCSRGRLLRRLWRILREGLYYQDSFELQKTLMSDFNGSLSILERLYKEEMEASEENEDVEDLPDTVDVAIEESMCIEERDSSPCGTGGEELLKKVLFHDYPNGHDHVLKLPLNQRSGSGESNH